MSKYETLEYDILSKDGRFEIRKYKSFYIVEHRNLDNKKMNATFSQLFKYISSDNEASMNINMTTPVLEEVCDDHKTMAFVMPKALGDKIPEPQNEDLSVQFIEEAVYAVITYSGFATGANIERHLDRLKDWIKSKHLVEVSNFIEAYYNPPLTLPFLKRNEILVQVTVENLII